MLRVYSQIALALVLGLGLTLPIRADQKDVPSDKQFQADTKLVKEVTTSLLSKMERVPGCRYWPPTVELLKDEDVPAQLRNNAYATFNNSIEQIKKGEDLNPHVVVTTGWLKTIDRQPDALAWVLGHELGHLHFKHPGTNPGRTDFTVDALSRKQEEDADIYGIKLMLSAGFSQTKAMAANMRLLNNRHGGSIGALLSDHPDWRDRFEKISGDPVFWRSMSAFTNGVVLLNAEQYAVAEDCFDRVVVEFPKCYEALVNLGYACLMQYCDGLTPSDLKEYAVGQVMCGGFYQRVKSLEPPRRGRDVKLWEKAVNSFRAALKLKPDLALAKADLGLAYLFHPDGKQADKAAEYLQEAVEGLEADKSMDPVTRACTFVNLGAAQLAGGDRKEGLAMLDKAVALVKKVEEGRAGMVRGAILYHQAMVGSDATEMDARKQAVDQFERYLGTSDPLSAWWDLAYERYNALCKAVEREPNTKAAFFKGLESQLRAPAGLILEGGVKVMLSDQIADVIKRLGDVKITNVFGSAMKRYGFEKYGIELLATDEVIAIILSSPNSPGIKLQARGVGGEEAIELKRGVEQSLIKQKMPGFDTYVSRELLVPDVYYHYYRQLGIAIRYDKHPYGKISELLLVRVPDPR